MLCKNCLNSTFLLLRISITVCLVNNWYVYIVRCADESLYTGITTDPERRVLEHNSDAHKGAACTRARRPVSLVYTENADSRSLAARREYQIKQLSRKEKLALVDNPLTNTMRLLSD